MTSRQSLSLLPDAYALSAALIAAVLLSLSSGHATASSRAIEVDGLLLPTDTRSAPDGESPFAGTWIGRWDGFLKTIFVIESVSPDGEATLVYSVAANPEIGFNRAWFRLKGRIDGRDLVASGSGLTITLSASETGRLRAVFGDGYSFAVLKRVDLLELTSGAGQIDWDIGATERLQTRLVEDGRDIALETILYRPPGPGPFPLAVINHGSTGMGTEEQAFKLTWSNDWLAELLNAKGYLAAFPQRRGRGQSDGLYDEGFGTDRSKGYTCEPSLSLAGANRALEDVAAAIAALKQRPDVTDGPVLLSGASRGGYLAAAYAGRFPEETAGVINFVGGWMGEACDTAAEINGTLAREAAGFTGQTLWLYGEDDPYYSIVHSQRMHAQFTQAGGHADFHAFKLRGSGNGHWVMAVPSLWQHLVEAYLDGLQARR
ncbi:alpha/beta hydrolase family protein [Hoeflea olei]|uniref:Dienelactone hydrolase domain-containing protein n=1 Tax=Hoeflea olei TaxID=1480615 RepID=A0A1C1YQ87_9HYPH|nr:dienelactone hydrolase family protein [Hoeflea olei]OCW55644.1 hypothetical protein AWJ14_06570 [Hoeflea olei]